ncbi:DUF6507 family protein [Actinosynnema sp. CS-041913]|uniref:DUF6507 family protein n=1 Tax=Actinosynnema sp. CS-041913 TaxID=3239917 RepID=UPI003D8D867D
MEYDIRGAEALGVRTRTAGALEDVENTARYIDEALVGGATAANSEPVATALAGFIAIRSKPGVAYVKARGLACLDACRTAVNAYERGDFDMVRNAQQAAASAPDPTLTIPARRPG